MITIQKITTFIFKLFNFLSAQLHFFDKKIMILSTLILCVVFFVSNSYAEEGVFSRQAESQPQQSLDLRQNNYSPATKGNSGIESTIRYKVKKEDQDKSKKKIKVKRNPKKRSFASMAKKIQRKNSRKKRIKRTSFSSMARQIKKK